MDIKIKEIAYHRNGCGGEGFYVSIFKATVDGKRRKMVGIVFGGSEEYNGRVAVFDIAELAKDNIAFAEGNSWRGDHFENAIRKAIAESNKECTDILKE